MEQPTTTEGTVQREALTGRQGAARPTDVTAPFRVWFSTKEVLELTGLSRNTLKFWRKRKWVVPACPCKGDVGSESAWSAWQTIALAILASAVRDVKDRRTYVGSTGVKRAWQALSGLSDELLLSEDQQGPYIAEALAAEIARASLTSSEDPALSPQILEGVGRVVQALDRKVQGMRNRVARRVSGE